MQLVQILDTAIRQDAEGRYSLNDLHRAAGGEKRHQVANFLRSDGVQSFIDVLNSTPHNRGVPALATVNGGRAPGTYADELVVYRYASWISAEFEVKVYGVFRDWARGAASRQMQELKAKEERNAARLERPGMTQALKDARAAQGKDTPAHRYSTEMDMINRLVLGMSAKQYREAHGIDASIPLRDVIMEMPAHITAIRDLQRTNQALIECGMEFPERKEKLQSVMMRKHNKLLMDEILRLQA